MGSNNVTNMLFYRCCCCWCCCAIAAAALNRYVVFPRHSQSSIQPSDRPCDELVRCDVCSNTSVRYIYIFWVMYQVRDFFQTHPVTGRATCFQILVRYIYINIFEWRIRQSRMYQVRDFSQTHSSPVTGRVMNWCSVPCFRILVWDIYFEMICAIYPTILMCGCTLELFYPTIVRIRMGFFYYAIVSVHPT